MNKNICSICGHEKKLHKGHISPDWTGEKINHISCRFIVKRSKVDLPQIGISSIGHNCSCHNFKPNTSLKRAIKKYQKFIKENKDISEYKKTEIKDAIKRFRKSIKDNPKNLLHWQLEDLKN